MMERGFDRSRARAAVLASAPSLGGAVTRPARSVWRELARLGRPAEAAGQEGDASGQTPSVPGPRLGLEPRARARLSLVQVNVAASLLVLSFFLLCALVPEWIATHAPTHMHAEAVLSPPGGEHWFGTDQFGRDVFSLVVFGARQSLWVGVCAVLVGCGVGVAIGLSAGYFGGWVDLASMRLIDIWQAIPNILLAIAISTALGPSLGTTILAVSVVSVPRYARVLRGRALAIRSSGFVLAARASGASHLAILRRHVLGHCLGPTLVLATLGVGHAILLAAGLSFLGLGINDDEPDWGYQLTQGRGYLTVAWWAVTYPGLALTALVVSINLLGDALRRRFDPRGIVRAERGS